MCKTLTLDLEETRTPGRRLTLEARAYNDGVAFRYVLPEQATLKEVRISGERTEFQLAKESTTYPLMLPGFHSPYEDDYHTLPVSGIHAGLPDRSAAARGTAGRGVGRYHRSRYRKLRRHVSRSQCARRAFAVCEAGAFHGRAWDCGANSDPDALAVACDHARRAAGAADGIEHCDESQSAFGNRGYFVDQAGQDGMGLVVGHLCGGRRFQARNEYRDHEALHRFLGGVGD